ncbi:imelysin family protein [Flavobacterium sp. NRK F7]|uniref:imelysin family protein n=1 Tax=Flavobacterium sp. NRK F7 TaxID=2954930 RepID=UPI002090BF1E|nr:imelysin family protein [Flavobacterium sp. NRK F7]MCO6163771.1 imelysin family protein [Flavobacterium sp. NRK F7]
MKKIVLGCFSLLFLIACSSDSSSNETNNDNFNRTELLTNWADNIIIPRYENYQDKVALLDTKVSTFVSTPDQTNLNEVRTAWLEAYKAYQYVGMFSIGKAELINLNSTVNIYPTNQAGIQTNITNGGYNFALLSQYDKQGLPAMDYMINGLASSDAEIIAFYETNPDATKYKQYLSDLANQLKVNIDAVVTDWNGTYRNTFISSNGNSVSSSTNKMVNSFIKYYEKDIRLGKVGYPCGAFVNDGNKYPEIVEAYFKNDVSKLLLEESIKASQDFFNGKYFNANTEGSSLKSYLDYLNTNRDGQNLSTIINNQFQTILTVNNSIDNSYSNQINSNNVKMVELYDALQLNIVYLKLDMMQALNITVDYVDNDGD